MLLNELALKKTARPELQVIATDIDPHALGIARKGSYSATAVEEVPPEYVDKYFIRRGSRFHVRKQLREICLFSIHNLVTDPPFSQIDLISCRNVLIYLGSHLQKKLFPVFHYSLKKGGYLFLGTSESLAAHRDLFRAVNAKERLAQKKATAIPMASVIPSSVHNYLNQFRDLPKDAQPDLALIGQRIALDEIPLKHAVVNDEGHIISGSPGISKYIEIGDGPFQNSIVKLSRPSIRPALRKTFAAAKQEKRKVTDETSTIDTGSGSERVGIIVQPMPQLGSESGLYWIAFQYLGAIVRPEQGTSRSVNEHDSGLVDQLEREVFVLRDELDKIVQDLEASNEELKSSNEELLSMNEELQSANEEMETSKEELQIVNEALLRANADLENLLAGTQIATLFLDPDLRIRGFTPAIADIYRIRPGDTGRDIRDFSSKAVEMPAYPSQLTDQQIEDEVRLSDGRIFERRILPYRNHESVTDGTVVTFIDVTKLRSLEIQYRDLADSMPNIVWTMDSHGHPDYWNNQWYKFTGFDRSEPSGWLPLLHGDDKEKFASKLQTSLENVEVFELEFRLWDKQSSTYRSHLGRIVPILNDDGSLKKWIGTTVDIHDRVAAEESRAEAHALFENISNAAPVLIWLSDLNRERIYFNREWLEFTGHRLEDSLNGGWQNAVHPEDLPKYLGIYGQHFDQKSEFYFEYRLRQHSGQYRWIGARGVPRFGAHGEFEGFIGACMDIHEQRKAREALKNSERQLENMIKTSPSFVAVVRGPEYIFDVVNDEYSKLIGRREVLGRPMFEAVPELRGLGFEKLLHEVSTTLVPFLGKEVAVYLNRQDGMPAEKRYLDFVYQPFQHVEGKADGILIQGVDVTERVMAKNLIENERANFRNLFMQTPEMVCILAGPAHVFEFVNEAHVRALGFDATGLSVREAQPESVEVHGILDDVYRTGKTAELEEIAVTLGSRVRYFNLTYAARRSEDQMIDGVMILGIEVTAEVLARESYKLQRDALQLAMNSAPLAEILDVIARMVELQVGGDLMVNILLADKTEKRLLHGAAPSLPAAYNDFIDGVIVGPHAGSFGAAAFHRKRVVVEDIQTSPIWTNLKEAAGHYGLRACWSTPIVSSRGKLLGVFSFYANTDRKPNELEIQYVEVASRITALIIERNLEISDALEREDQLAFATTSANMGMWRVTLPDGKVFLSDEAAKIFGFSKEYGDTNKAIDELIHPDHRERAREVLAHAIARRTLYNDVYRIIRPGGEIRWINARGHVRLNEDGVPYVLSGLIMDVTVQKNAESAIQDARQSAENASAAKTMFLANMSHEIRTPLSAIVGFSDLLKAEVVPDTLVGSYVQRISRNAMHLGRLIDELLDLSKIEADKLEVEQRSFDVDTVIEDVYSMLSLRAKSKGIALEFNWKSPKPANIVSDPLRLSQIIMNIVGNAVKFTNQGQVRVDFSFDKDVLTIRVKDTGVGLTQLQQDKIFEPFVQADSSVSRKFGGTGLGLTLSKRLAHLLGGDLVLEQTELGHGSCFRIEIKAPISVLTNGGVATQGVQTGPSAVLRGRTVLVVDDSIDNRLLVTLFLKSTGVQIIEAADGEEGVESALKNNPDLVLMDIQMPMLDGYQALQKLKSSGFQKPIVALTAHAFNEERERCLSLGFSGYVTKPMSKVQLVTTLQELIR